MEQRGVLYHVLWPLVQPSYLSALDLICRVSVEVSSGARQSDGRGYLIYKACFIPKGNSKCFTNRTVRQIKHLVK